MLSATAQRKIMALITDVCSAWEPRSKISNSLFQDLKSYDIHIAKVLLKFARIKIDFKDLLRFDLFYRQRLAHCRHNKGYTQLTSVAINRPD